MKHFSYSVNTFFLFWFGFVLMFLFFNELGHWLNHGLWLLWLTLQHLYNVFK